MDRRFFNDENFTVLVRDSWFGSVGQHPNIDSRIGYTRRQIAQWKRRHAVNAKTRITTLLKLVDEAQVDINCTHTHLSKLKYELRQAYRDEEHYWRIKSRNQWLRGGDRNTKYFHACAKNRIARNRIVGIKDSSGHLVFGSSNIGQEAAKYYTTLFTTSHPGSINSIFTNFIPLVTQDMNTRLTMDISEEEIKAALFSIGADKAPGPDGITAAFYQHYWDIVKTSLVLEVRRFFTTQEMGRSIAHTNLCLLPKTKSPNEFKNFRPIGLCNVIYKIISKILVNRLKPILSSLVTEEQAAFIPGRSITDNVFIAHEALHALRTQPSCAKAYMTVKTDISKAYDRVEWDFVESSLRYQGFSDKWIGWVMACIRSATFSVLVNGQAYGSITPTRGIRQGDPLSPYIFILCANALSVMVHQAAQQGKIQGLRLSRTGPTITHLLFADDSLFFLRTTEDNCRNIKHIFDEYERASGQLINFEKSSITFGSKVFAHTREKVKSLLGINNMGGQGKYLGLPEQFGRRKKEMLAYITNRLKEKTRGWHTKFLSPAGKEILIKSVAYAMPVYAMNCFVLPVGLTEDISKIMANYWWGSSDQGKKISWVAWKKLQKSKTEGGLGFRDIAQFNKALLANQVWKILSRPQSLVYRIFKGKYFPNSSLLSVTTRPTASYGWKSLLVGRDLLNRGLRVNIGNGNSTQLGVDAWLPTIPARPPRLQQGTDPTLLVSQLIDSTTRQWKEEQLGRLIVLEDQALVRGLYLSRNPSHDHHIWNYTKHGYYTVKSGYHLSMETENGSSDLSPPLAQARDIAKDIWSVSIPPKLKHFLWRASSGAIAIKTNLRRRGLTVNPFCERCGNIEEDTNHVFFTCNYAQATWRVANSPCLSFINPSPTFEDNLRCLLMVIQHDQLDEFHKQLPMWVLWRLWKARNDLFFNKRELLPKVTVDRAVEDTIEWTCAMAEEKHELPIPEYQRDGDWQAPPEGWVKCNFDAAFQEQSEWSGLGWILRDATGAFLKGGHTSATKRSNAEETEFESLIWAMQSMWSLKFNKIIFEGDCLTLIQAIHSHRINLRLAPYLNDIHKWKRVFQDIQFKFIRREGNTIADRLAREGINTFSNHVYLDCCPSYICNDLLTG